MNDAAADLTPRSFRLGLLVVLLLAAALRGLYPAADPPWVTTVGIVWHDEGAWVHNARNKALFGAWTMDAWNPVYIAPVFTGLEYAAFRMFGVGVRQARLVPEICGLLSVWLLALGVARVGGRRAGLVAGGLLATQYVYVMWNRAALMEGPMVAFMVASWYCYARASTAPRWGAAAAGLAMLAFFTKASAAFFVATLALDAGLAITGLFASGPVGSTTYRKDECPPWVVGGLAGFGLLAVIFFVAPHWADYRFYNWQMSVTRKPSYTVRALLDRVTWFPILHDLLTRSWFAVAVGLTTALGMLARWRSLQPAERLLILWIAFGAAELILHDVGNERRFVLFIPPLVALAALAVGRGALRTAGARPPAAPPRPAGAASRALCGLCHRRLAGPARVPLRSPAERPARRGDRGARDRGPVCDLAAAAARARPGQLDPGRGAGRRRTRRRRPARPVRPVGRQPVV